MRSIFKPDCKSEGVSRIAIGDTEKISEDVRQYAESHGYDEKEALEKGMAEMVETFVQKGAEVYQKA